MMRDRKYQLRTSSSELTDWNEAARRRGLRTSAWARERLNEAALEDLRVAVVESEVCVECGVERAEHDLLGRCPAVRYATTIQKNPFTFVGGTERAASAAPPGDSTLLEEVGEILLPVVVDPEVPPGQAELRDNGVTLAKITSISEGQLRNQSIPAERRPLANDCRGADLHWRLRKGESCRWCGGVG